MTVPVIIPLGEGSTHNNAELRFLLRSLERNALDLGEVYIATLSPPEWLRGACVVPIPDTHAHCKDANLIDKTLRVIERNRLDSFAWCADDNAIVRPIRLDSIPMLYNERVRSDFGNGSKWHRRVLNTFNWADSQGVPLEHSFESHAPQFFRDAKELARRMRRAPYAKGDGLTIMTAFRVAMRETTGGLPQSRLKDTYEKECEEAVKAAQFLKPFIGYNDGGINCGILARLEELFPHKSRFEE